jgi:hypothetical protein
MRAFLLLVDCDHVLINLNWATLLTHGTTQEALASAAAKSQEREQELHSLLQAAQEEAAGAHNKAAQLRASCSDSEGVRAQVSTCLRLTSTCWNVNA